MTKNNFQKTAIRARMAETGEPYSVAARAIASMLTPTWPSLDKAIDGGFKPGRLYVVGSRPGVGKTLVAINLAVKLSKPNQPVGFVNLELTTDELYSALIQADTGVNVSAFREQNLDGEQQTAADLSRKHLAKNVVILDEVSSIEKIREFVASQPKLKVLVIDHYQLMDTAAAVNIFEKREYIAQAVKKLALELDIAVILMAQLSRSFDKTSLTLTEAINSSNLIAGADVVILLSRPEHGHTLTLKVAKHRQGALGSFDLSWPENTRKLVEIEVG